MLILSLYSEAYSVSGSELYLEIINETFDFIMKDMLGEYHNFYSALDADSIDKSGKKVEGAYYVWGKEELKKILGKDFELFSKYFNVNDYGYWEHGNYVLIKNKNIDDFAKENNIDVELLKSKIEGWKQNLLNIRGERIAPEIDDKSLLSWNSLMAKALLDAYNKTNNLSFKDAAKSNIGFIEEKLMKDKVLLQHNFAKAKSTINGFLEDYALLIDTFIAMYQVEFEEKYIFKAKELSDYVLKHFYDSKSGMFFFTSDEDSDLLSRKIETYDGVIPSSNSVMASNLLKLYHFFMESEYYDIVEQMLKNMQELIAYNPSAYSNWLNVFTDFNNEFFEIAIVGENAYEFAEEINKKYIPNKIIAASMVASDVPLLKDRYQSDETLIFICTHGTCNMPSKSLDSAMKILEAE
ncbi:MAG: hypothetical protein R2771_08110 [Saprospiraceae bacterium]